MSSSITPESIALEVELSPPVYAVLKAFRERHNLTTDQAIAALILEQAVQDMTRRGKAA